MMAVIFAGMGAGLLSGWLGHRRLAIMLVAAALFLAIYLFLWEVDSPAYGFRMPWIQT